MTLQGARDGCMVWRSKVDEAMMAGSRHGNDGPRELVCGWDGFEFRVSGSCSAELRSALHHTLSFCFSPGYNPLSIGHDQQ